MRKENYTRIFTLSCILFLLLSSILYALNIKSDEDITFYPSAAVYNTLSNQWEVHIHGHVYEPEENSLIRNAVIGTIKETLSVTNITESATLKRRLRQFLADNERWKSIIIDIGGKDYTLNRTKPNGHIEQTIILSSVEIQAILKSNSSKRTISYTAVLQKNDPRIFEGKIFIVKPEDLIVISDIDDTIKISDVRNKKSLIANTFLEPFKPVPGMARLYSGFAKDGAVLYYLSASPWQLYADISDFLHTNGFPDGLFTMKFFRVKDSDFLNLLQKPFTYKTESIESIISMLPRNKFICIGDNGEQDPEAYGFIAQKYPNKIEKIFIREAYTEDGTERYAKAFNGVPKNKWEIFTDAGKITYKIRK